MSAFRFGIYVHGDSVTRNKGAAAVVASSAGPFADTAAKFAFASAAAGWADVAAAFPEAEEARLEAGAAVVDAVTVSLGRGEAGAVFAASADGRAAVVKVLSVTDFAAKTEVFRRFAADAAAAAARSAAGDAEGLLAAVPGVAEAAAALSKELGERVVIGEVRAVSLPVSA